jgi:hypothetical protein
MTKPRLGVRDRRALTIGAGLIAMVLLSSRGVPAMLAWQREKDRDSDARQEKLERAMAAMSRVSSVRDSIRARGARIVALAPALVAGDTPASASASLAELMSGAAALSNVKLGALQLHADTTSRDAFVRVGVHGEATGDVTGVMSMLASLESGPTLLAVRELSITQPEPSAPADHMETLHVELTVEGLMLRQRAPEKR